MSRTASYKSGGTHVSDAQNFGSNLWNNPGNASASDDTNADATMMDSTSELLVAKNFDWDLGSEAKIEGIEVRIEKYRGSGGGNVSDNYVTIINADGTAEGSNKAIVGVWPTTDTTSSYGGPSDMWGLTLTGTDVDDVDFGIGIAADGTMDGTADQTGFVDYMEMQLTYHYEYAPVPTGGLTGGGNGTYGAVYVNVIGGGSTAAGAAAAQKISDVPADGGATSGGVAAPTQVFNPLAAGGAAAGGSATQTLWDVVAVGGGATSGGVAAVTQVFNPSAAGGLLAGGQYGDETFYPSGGSTAGGTSVVLSVFVPSASGGVLGGGIAPTDFTVSGGSVAGGLAHTTINRTQQAGGGATAGGVALLPIYFTHTPSGGATLGGLSEVVDSYHATGGATAGGTAFIVMGHIGVGGAVLGTTAGVAFFDYLDGGGGISVGGVANDNSTKILRHTMSGGVDAEKDVVTLVPGTYHGGVTSVHYNASGGINLDNALDPTIVNHRFDRDIEFLWRLRAFVVNDMTFLWSTGQLGIFFYRIVGKARQGDECNLKSEPCCQKFIMNIHARTIAELCEKISERKFILPIESVQKFARPAALGNIFDDFANQQRLIREFDEENGDCNELIPVEICDVPQCADFCVDFDLVVSSSFDIVNTQVNASPEYESGDGDSADREIFIAGAAEVTLVKFLPEFTFVSSGMSDAGAGIVLTDGLSGSRTEPNSWVGRGGAKVGGVTADVEFSNWVYVAGEYPTINSEFPDVFVTVNDLDGESNDPGVAWQFPERARANDDLYTQADISFSKTSEWLIVKRFYMNVPTDAEIQSITVYVDRLSSQVSTKDDSVRLVLGDQIVSGTRSLPNGSDWPLIETRFKYPTTLSWKLDFESDPWITSEVNDPEFGFALKVKDVGNTSGAIAQVDSIEMEAIWEFPDKQLLRTGGTAKVVSSAYSYVGSGGVSLESAFVLKVEYTYNSTGLGSGQPTAFVIGGNYATTFDYTADDVGFAWENDSTIDLGNVGTVAYWPQEGENKRLDELLGGPVDSDAEWMTPERARIADATTTTSPSYAEADVGGVDKASEFLVVRDWDLDFPDHVRIHGIRVVLGNRFAQNIPNPGVTDVRDTYLYLVNGDTIRSDNLAKTADTWPEFPTSLFYGSTGFDGSTQFRDLDVDPLTPDEVNNPNFGVAIAVTNSDTTADTVAKIDGIAMEFTIEVFGRIQVAVTEPTIGGSADAFPSFTDYFGGGGVAAGGGADVEPFWETGSGGVEVNVTLDPLELLLERTNERVIYNHAVSGGVALGGIAFTPEGVFGYTASGGVSMSGSADRKRNAWSFVSDANNAIFVQGSAGYAPADYGTLTTSMGHSMVILQTNAKFADDVDAQDAESLTSLVSQCGCLQLPLTVEFGHNFARDNIFSQFLIRNNFTISKKLFLRYNVTNDSWQTNLHYKGLSADANTEEKWDIVFDLQCTDNLGGINIGRRIWKLAMGAQRKNLTTQEDFDTRVILGILPEPLCDVNANELDFEVNYNTLLDVADVNPEATIYQSSIFDNIGLFRNRGWTESPDLIFSVSQSGLQEEQERVDLTDPVLNPADANRFDIFNRRRQPI